MQNNSKINPNPKYEELINFVGQKAIVARGLVEAFMGGETKLRKCQESAIDFAEEYDLVIPRDKPSGLTSRIGRHLRDAGVFQQLDPAEKRTGYVLRAGKNYEAFADFLEEREDYGTRLEGTHADDLSRITLLKHLEDTGAVRANLKSHKIAPKSYKILVDRMKAGELDVIFVKAGSVAAVKHDGATHKIGYYVDN